MSANISLAEPLDRLCNETESLCLQHSVFPRQVHSQKQQQPLLPMSCNHHWAWEGVTRRRKYRVHMTFEAVLYYKL